MNYKQSNINFSKDYFFNGATEQNAQEPLVKVRKIWAAESAQIVDRFFCRPGSVAVKHTAFSEPY